MNEMDLNAIIEKTVQYYSEKEIVIKKIQYVMDFGDVTVQYDFCLN